MSIDAMKQALEALEYASTGNRRPEVIAPAVTALRQAIEQAEKQEPVAWWCCIPGQDAVLLFDEPRDEQYPPGYKEPLYPSPPPRHPLTDEQIYEICTSLGMAQLSPLEVARAIEAAHGIKGEA